MKSVFNNNSKLKTKNFSIRGCPRLKFGFTLVEVLIVVSILGILAAIVFPHYQGQVQAAKESAAKESLRILSDFLSYNLTINEGGASLTNAAEYSLKEVPENPFNNKNSILTFSGEFPDEATGTYGWLYNLSTRTLKLDWPGVDSTGLRYYNY